LAQFDDEEDRAVLSKEGGDGKNPPAKQNHFPLILFISTASMQEASRA